MRDIDKLASPLSGPGSPDAPNQLFYIPRLIPSKTPAQEDIDACLTSLESLQLTENSVREESPSTDEHQAMLPRLRAILEIAENAQGGFGDNQYGEVSTVGVKFEPTTRSERGFYFHLHIVS